MLFIKKVRSWNKISIRIFGIECDKTVLRLFVWKNRGSVFHAKRIEEHLFENIVDRFVADSLNDSGGELTGKSVNPVRARITGKRCFGHGR